MSGEKGWGRGGKSAAWTNLVLQAALLAGALLVANLIARKVPKRYDLTSRQTYALSNASEDVIRTLGYDLTAWLNLAEYEATGDKALRTALSHTQELLLEIQRRNPRIRVFTMGAGGIPEGEFFQKHFSVISPTTIYLVAALGPGKTNKKIVSVQDLFEGNSATGELTAFRGEGVLVHALRELGGSTRRIVYQTEGHQEYVMEDAVRMRTLQRVLAHGEGVEFRRLDLMQTKSVPLDADALVILGPAQPFRDHEIGLLRDFLERGGSLLVAVRARVKTALEPLLEEYGARVGDNLVHDGVEYNPPRRTDLLVRDFQVHAINRTLVMMANVSFVVPECSTVDPVEKRGAGWATVPLMRSGPQSWEEKGETGPGKPTPRPDNDERGGHLPLVVAVEKPASKPLDARHAQARLLVWGSATPFTNAVLGADPFVNEFQRDYMVNNFRWLVGRELMNIDSRKVSVRPLEASAGAIGRLKLAVVWGFPSVGVVLGLVVWFLRRK